MNVRWMIVALALPMLLLGTGSKLKRLDEQEIRHHRALQVFMSKDMMKAWLKLKERSDRDAFLKQYKLWDKFYQYDEAVQDKILAGEVKGGWHREQVFMAWGPPHKKERLTGRPASRSERFTYRFEVDKNGDATPLGRKSAYKGVSRLQMEVYIDDDYVTEIVRKTNWD